ncbi:MAG: type IV pilus assembly protein PilM, partial [Planctomycetota bacterium]|nr:type IV pilus assembly protein PilM [Planctomycetota bacterium]
MAKQQAVWGIDIGQCAVKALRCVPDSSGSGVVADAFDYIEYPKVLSQPDAEPETLIKEALEQFLSRNEVRGDKVAISVSGQAGLSRFFKPPPVDPRTLPDIVKYEAKQQIPFQLEDVIWDFQQIGGTVIDGLTVDAEIGIFAMKREAVFKALQPFADAEIEVDVIQLSPLAIYNVVLNEVLTDVPSPEEIDPNNPPESLIVLSMGTDTTDLVITDGIHLWQRNIPIGGNHFTKQLSRELKLTYAKAEHLKRNISTKTKEEGRTVLQAMKPVFNDLVTEINRSISYFQGINKKAKIGQVLVLGNAAKLVGLRQYLTKSLSSEIVKLNNYKSLGGEAVTGSKQFGDNVLSYAVSYGLCLQTLGQAKLDTN